MKSMEDVRNELIKARKQFESGEITLDCFKEQNKALGKIISAENKRLKELKKSGKAV